MNAEKFRALLVHKTEDNRYIQELGEKKIDELPAGDLLVRIREKSW